MSSEAAEAARRNVWRYLAFSVLVHTPFFVPIVVLFWEANGLSLGEVFALQGLYAIATVVLEVPTGMLADRLGKRTSLLAAAASFVVGLLVYSVGTGFAEFLVAEIVLALASALLSGADSALLYDTLSSAGREHEYTRIEGRARAAQMASFAASNVLGGLIGAWSLRATLPLSAVGPMLGFVIAWGFVELGDGRAGASWRDAWSGYRKLLGDSLRFVGRHRLVRWHLLFLAVLTGSSTWLLWLYQPHMRWVGVPVWAFGIVFAGHNLTAAVASWYTDRFEALFGERGALAVLAVLQVLPLVGMAIVVHPVAVLFVAGHQAVRGLGRPLLARRVLDHTWSDKRSTVLSLGALGARLFFAVTAPVVGLAAERLDLSGALLVQAALLVGILGVLAVERARIPAKYERVKSVVRP